MPVEIVSGASPRWADHVGDEVPIHASRPWTDSTSHRLTPRRLTFLADVDGQRGGLHAAVVEDPAADEMINVWKMLLADPKVFKFPPEAITPRAGLRERVAPPEAWVPNLIVLYPGFDCFVTASGGPRPALAETVVDSVLSWGVEHEMKAVSFLYTREDTELPALLAGRGFRCLPLTYRSRLTLGATFEDYLTGLPRKVRREVGREQRHLAEAGIRTEAHSLTDVWDDVLDLRCDLVERYGQTPNRELEAMNLQRQLDCFGKDGTRLYCSFLGDRMVGFSLYVVWRDTWYASYTGTLVSPQTRYVYFDHLFYAPIAGAIAEGARVFDVGIGAWAAKKRRGCTLTAVDMWVRTLDPAVERAVSIAAPVMARELGSV